MRSGVLFGGVVSVWSQLARFGEDLLGLPAPFPLEWLVYALLQVGTGLDFFTINKFRFVSMQNRTVIRCETVSGAQGPPSALLLHVHAALMRLLAKEVQADRSVRRRRALQQQQAQQQAGADHTGGSGRAKQALTVALERTVAEEDDRVSRMGWDFLALCKLSEGTVGGEDDNDEDGDDDGDSVSDEDEDEDDEVGDRDSEVNVLHKVIWNGRCQLKRKLSVAVAVVSRKNSC
jgi:hypothetical protein